MYINHATKYPCHAVLTNGIYTKSHPKIKDGRPLLKYRLSSTLIAIIKGLINFQWLDVRLPLCIIHHMVAA